MPGVTYQSYEAAALGFGIAMLAGSATFQTLVGATDALTALSKIIEHDGGTPSSQAGVAGKAKACDGTSFTLAGASWAQVAQTTVPGDSTVATGWTKRSGEIRIALVIKPTASHTPPERTRNAANITGLVRDEIEAQLGQPGKLALADVSYELMPLPDATGSMAGYTSGLVTITWRNS